MNEPTDTGFSFRGTTYIFSGLVGKLWVRRYRREAVGIQSIDPLQRVRSGSGIQEFSPGKI